MTTPTSPFLESLAAEHATIQQKRNALVAHINEATTEAAHLLGEMRAFERLHAAESQRLAAEAVADDPA